MSFMSETQQAYAPALADSAAENDQPSVDRAGLNQPMTGNVDKIREILFGGQMRDYDKRFSRLEERLVKESADQRAETKRLFESLETFVQNEIEALTERLQAEQHSRETAVQSVSGELRETGKALEAKLQQADERTSRTERDLRQQILDQSKSLIDEMARKHEDLSATFAREVAELSHGKADRASLSALFTEVAMRLNNEFEIPGDN